MKFNRNTAAKRAERGFWSALKQLVEIDEPKKDETMPSLNDRALAALKRMSKDKPSSFGRKELASNPQPTRTVPRELLTVEDAANELSVEEWEVMRLIARGTIDAQTVGNGQVRIERGELTKAAGDDIQTALRPMRDWFDARAIRFRGDAFVSMVRGELLELMPDDDPGEDLAARYEGRLRQIGREQPSSPLVSGLAPDLPYRTNAEVFAASRILELAEMITRRRSTRVGLRVMSGIGKLYASPEEYRAITDEAWRRFTEAGITAETRYSGRVRRIRLSNGAISDITKDSVLRLTF